MDNIYKDIRDALPKELNASSSGKVQTTLCSCLAALRRTHSDVECFHRLKKGFMYLIKIMGLWASSSSKEHGSVLSLIMECLMVVIEHGVKSSSYAASCITRVCLCVVFSDKFLLQSRIEILNRLNMLFESTDTSVKNILLGNGLLGQNLNKLYQLVLDIGDYEVQVCVMEFLLRVIPSVLRQKYSTTLIGDPKTRQSFLAMRDSYFEVDCRKFLNELNESQGTSRKVFSYPCHSIMFGSVELQKPCDVGYDEFWLDINMKSKRIIIFCESSSPGSQATVDEDSWNTVSIWQSDIHKCLCQEEAGQLHVKLYVQSTAACVPRGCCDGPLTLLHAVTNLHYDLEAVLGLFLCRDGCPEDSDEEERRGSLSFTKRSFLAHSPAHMGDHSQEKQAKMSEPSELMSTPANSHNMGSVFSQSAGIEAESKETPSVSSSRTAGTRKKSDSSHSALYRSGRWKVTSASPSYSEVSTKIRSASEPAAESKETPSVSSSRTAETRKKSDSSHSALDRSGRLEAMSVSPSRSTSSSLTAGTRKKSDSSHSALYRSGRRKVTSASPSYSEVSTKTRSASEPAVVVEESCRAELRAQRQIPTSERPRKSNKLSHTRSKKSTVLCTQFEDSNKVYNFSNDEQLEHLHTSPKSSRYALRVRSSRQGRSRERAQSLCERGTRSKTVTVSAPEVDSEKLQHKTVTNLREETSKQNVKSKNKGQKSKSRKDTRIPQYWNAAKKITTKDSKKRDLGTDSKTMSCQALKKQEESFEFTTESATPETTLATGRKRPDLSVEKQQSPKDKGSRPELSTVHKQKLDCSSSHGTRAEHSVDKKRATKDKAGRPECSTFSPQQLDCSSSHQHASPELESLWPSLFRPQQNQQSLHVPVSGKKQNESEMPPIETYRSHPPVLDDDVDSIMSLIIETEPEPGHVPKRNYDEVRLNQDLDASGSVASSTHEDDVCVIENKNEKDKPGMKNCQVKTPILSIARNIQDGCPSSAKKSTHWRSPVSVTHGFEIYEESNHTEDEDSNHPEDEERNHTEDEERNHTEDEERNHTEDEQRNHTEDEKRNHTEDEKRNHTEDEERNHTEDEQRNHTEDEEINHTEDEERNHTEDEERNHTEDEERNHTEDEEINHTEDEERNHTEDEDSNHTEDEERNHTEDEDSNHTEDEVSNHPEDEDSNHTEDEEINHTEDEERNHTEDEDSNHTEDEERNHTDHSHSKVSENHKFKTLENRQHKIDAMLPKGRSFSHSEIQSVRKPQSTKSDLGNPGNKSKQKPRVDGSSEIQSVRKPQSTKSDLGNTGNKSKQKPRADGSSEIQSVRKPQSTKSDLGNTGNKSKQKPRADGSSEIQSVRKPQSTKSDLGNTGNKSKQKPRADGSSEIQSVRKPQSTKSDLGNTGNKSKQKPRADGSSEIQSVRKPQSTKSDLGNTGNKSKQKHRADGPASRLTDLHVEEETGCVSDEENSMISIKKLRKRGHVSYKENSDSSELESATEFRSFLDRKAESSVLPIITSRSKPTHSMNASTRIDKRKLAKVNDNLHAKRTYLSSCDDDCVILEEDDVASEELNKGCRTPASLGSHLSPIKFLTTWSPKCGKDLYQITPHDIQKKKKKKKVQKEAGVSATTSAREHKIANRQQQPVIDETHSPKGPDSRRLSAGETCIESSDTGNALDKKSEISWIADHKSNKPVKARNTYSSRDQVLSVSRAPQESFSPEFGLLQITRTFSRGESATITSSLHGSLDSLLNISTETIQDALSKSGESSDVDDQASAKSKASFSWVPTPRTSVCGSAVSEPSFLSQLSQHRTSTQAQHMTEADGGAESQPAEDLCALPRVDTGGEVVQGHTASDHDLSGTGSEGLSVCEEDHKAQLLKKAGLVSGPSSIIRPNKSVLKRKLRPDSSPSNEDEDDDDEDDDDDDDGVPKIKRPCLEPRQLFPGSACMSGTRLEISTYKWKSHPSDKPAPRKNKSYPPDKHAPRMNKSYPPDKHAPRMNKSYPPDKHAPRMNKSYPPDKPAPRMNTAVFKPQTAESAWEMSEEEETMTLTQSQLTNMEQPGTSFTTLIKGFSLDMQQHIKSREHQVQQLTTGALKLSHKRVNQLWTNDKQQWEEVVNDFKEQMEVELATLELEVVDLNKIETKTEAVYLEHLKLLHDKRERLRDGVVSAIKCCENFRARSQCTQNQTHQVQRELETQMKQDMDRLKNKLLCDMQHEQLRRVKESIQKNFF